MLDLKSSDIVVDATVGLAGHSKEFVKDIKHLIAFDQDINALTIAKKNLSDFKEKTSFVNQNFENMESVLKELDIVPTVIFADIGVSSMQFDDPDRGFSFRYDADLDMRMDIASSLTARDLIEKSSAAELEKIFLEYGELPFGFVRRFVNTLVEKRELESIDTTYKLAKLIDEIKIKHTKRKINPTQLVFQALRIATNNELGVLERMLESSFNILPVGGRIGIISFHSLEDRIVKRFFRHWSKPCLCPKSQLICNCAEKFPKRLKIKRPFPTFPSDEEVKENKRSRSAKLRVVEIISA